LINSYIDGLGLDPNIPHIILSLGTDDAHFFKNEL